MTASSNSETTLLITGPAGNLEVIDAPAEVSHNPPIIAIICHPHPQFGGTMHNKVVSTLARAFKNQHIQTIRFNFRGVGQSEGEFADGVGELADLMAIISWVQNTYPGKEMMLAGFSFGGYIAAKAAIEVDFKVIQLVSVAPQASRFTTKKFPEMRCPWLIIQGENDEVVPPEEVYAWIKTLKPQPVLIKMPGAGHFFHGKLKALREALEDNLSIQDTPI